MKHGMKFGVLLVLGLFKAAISLPLALGYLLLSTQRLQLRQNAQLLAVLLILKLAWLGGIYVLYKQDTLLAFAQLISMDLVLLTTLLVRKREEFFQGLAVPIFTIFLVDVLFNAWMVVMGVDPLGRIYTARPDDYLPRLGGVFFHPFYSINISFMALLFALYLNKKSLLALSILNVLGNGSYRGVVTLAVFSLAYVLIKRRTHLPLVVACSLAVVAGVFAATYYSIALFEGGSGNYYRVFAWVTALEGIVQRPWTGQHTFATEPLETLNEESIREHGIAESTYLHYALHYGVVPAVLHGLILFLALTHSLRAWSAPSANRFTFVSAVFACLAFIDSFYGTLVGSVLTSMCFGLFVFSGRQLNPPVHHYVVMKATHAPASL